MIKITVKDISLLTDEDLFSFHYLLQGWYIVTYALAIYLLNLFIAFLSPKFDPAHEMEEDEGIIVIITQCCCLLFLVLLFSSVKRTSIVLLMFYIRLLFFFINLHWNLHL